MLHEILEIVLRTVGAFILIMIIARLLGKQTFAQMTYHDFVAAITLGALTATLANNMMMKAWHVTLSLLLFSCIVIGLTFVAIKSRPARKWINGQPTVVIQNGKILENNLKMLRLTLDTLNQELREKEIFDVEEVEYAVLELNGKVSVLRKPEYQQVKRKDLQLAQAVKPSFPIELIMDGKTVADNLQQYQISEEWLQQQLDDRGYRKEQIDYAVKGTNGKLFIDLYKDDIKHPIDKE